MFNNLKFNKIFAFTLIEVILSLLICSILISIIFFSTNIIQKQFIAYQKRTENILSLLNFKFLLETDFNNSNSIVISQEEGITNVITLQQIDREVKYKIYDSLIVRNQESMDDTFRFSMHKNLVSLEGREVSVFPSLIDEVSIEIILHDELLRMKFNKFYSPSELINYSSEIKEN